jgi:hypothetical protein
MAFIDHSYKTCVEAEELTAPPEGSIFTCEWAHHPHGYYVIGCRPGKDTYLDVDAVEEFEFCPYCSGEIDMWNAVVGE